MFSKITCPHCSELVIRKTWREHHFRYTHPKEYEQYYKNREHLQIPKETKESPKPVALSGKRTRTPLKSVYDEALMESHTLRRKQKEFHKEQQID